MTDWTGKDCPFLDWAIESWKREEEEEEGGRRKKEEEGGEGGKGASPLAAFCFSNYDVIPRRERVSPSARRAAVVANDTGGPVRAVILVPLPCRRCCLSSRIATSYVVLTSAGNRFCPQKPQENNNNNNNNTNDRTSFNEDGIKSYCLF